MARGRHGHPVGLAEASSGNSSEPATERFDLSTETIDLILGKLLSGFGCLPSSFRRLLGRGGFLSREFRSRSSLLAGRQPRSGRRVDQAEVVPLLDEFEPQ